MYSALASSCAHRHYAEPTSATFMKEPVQSGAWSFLDRYPRRLQLLLSALYTFPLCHASFFRRLLTRSQR
jgi:hypothetical protein